MKKIIALSLIFAVLGMSILVVTLILCLNSLNGTAIMINQPVAALECSEQLAHALQEGDFDAVTNCLYGQVDLGVHREPKDEATKLLWEAFADSITCQFIGDCYATTTGVARDLWITTMDPASVNSSLSQRVDELLEARINEAADISDIYDDDGDFREDLLDELLLEALAEAIDQEATTVTHQVQLNLVHQNGQWWVVPDAALLQAISGGVAG